MLRLRIDKKGFSLERTDSSLHSHEKPPGLVCAVQLQGDDIDGTMLQPWLDLHQAPTTSLDINAGGARCRT